MACLKPHSKEAVLSRTHALNPIFYQDGFLYLCLFDSRSPQSSAWLQRRG